MQRMSRVIRGSGAWFTERVSREGVSMKYMGPIVAVFLLAICAPAWAVVLPEEVAKKPEQRIDAFADAPGHERPDANARRSEEPTSEIQFIMRNTSAASRLTKKKIPTIPRHAHHNNE